MSQMARLAKNNDIISWDDTNQELISEAARHAIVEQSRRNGTVRQTICFSSIFDRQIDRGIDRSHVLISGRPMDDRFDNRIDPRTAIEAQRTSASISSSSSCVLPPPTPPHSLHDLCLRFLLPRMNDRFLSSSICMHASFFFCCPSSALASIT